MLDVLRRLTAALDDGREAILCQVAETRGSTPQKAGAAMLVDPEGGQVGTLGGGCVEAEVKQRAAGRLGREGAERFDFVLDHDYAWADGLICGGKMVVLAEALRGPDAVFYYGALLAALESGRGLIEAVIVDPAAAGAPMLGARFLFGPAGELLAARPEGPVPEAVAAVVDDLPDRPRPIVRRGVAILPIAARVRLVIVGAGHVGQAVADLAARADFEIEVVDDRGHYARADRFPAGSRLTVGSFDETLPALAATLGPSDYALVVTRGHGHDQEALAHLAPTAAGFVGLIGSRRKIRLIYDALSADGIDPAALARVAAPVGLDIGSQTVPEIAISIVAQLIARRNLGRDPRPFPGLDRAGAASS